MGDSKYKMIQDIIRPNRNWVYFFLALALFWTLAIAISLVRDINQQNINAYEAAKIQAIEALNKDLVYRRWVAGHGGVYVPESDNTPPNPFLSKINERDITTPSGKKLTLVNPAYMTRQVYELAQEQYGVRGHITSLTPLRPENKPDEWEMKALKEFEKGAKEVSSIGIINDEPYLRIMIPLITEEKCLKCHLEQGYKVGDLRGGISTSSPVKPHMNTAKAFNQSLLVDHMLILFAGLLGIATSGFFIIKRNYSQSLIMEEVRQYACIVASSSDIMALLDKQYNYLAVNEAFLKTFRMSKAQVIGHSAADILGQDYFNNIVKPNADTCLKGEEVHYESWFDFPENSRKYLTVTYSPYMDSSNTILGFTVNAKDTTKQKQAEDVIKSYNIKLEKQVKERTEKLEKEIKERINAEHELKNATSRLIQTEKLSTIGQLAASMAHEINNPLGAIYSSSNVIENQFNELIHNIETEFNIYKNNKDLINTIIYRLPENKPYLSYKQTRQIKKDIEDNLKQIGISNAKNASAFLVRVGITKEYEPIIPVFQSQCCDNIMEFILRISDIIDSKNIINTAIQQSSKVIQALKDYSRSNENQKAVEANIKETIETALILYGNKIKHGITLVTNFDEVPNITGYPHELSQVWTNIIHNAIQAMDNCGILTIDLKHQNDNIEVSITDTGKGIPDAIKHKIFDPLFTTKKQGEGTGLGLDIAKKIIERHNGSIHLISEENHGSTFTVKLPVMQTSQVHLETA